MGKLFGTILGGLNLLRSEVSGKRDNVFLAGKLQAGDQLTCYQKHFETDVTVNAVNSGDVSVLALAGILRSQAAWGIGGTSV